MACWELLLQKGCRRSRAAGSQALLMFKRHHSGRRSPNIVFVIFRLCLSIVIFAVLTVGAYSAYKHFSGVDPLKSDPKTLILSFLESAQTTELIDQIFGLKLADIGRQKVIGLVKKDSSTTASEGVTTGSPGSKAARPAANKERLFSFLAVADSHNDNLNLGKALNQGRALYPDIRFVIGLGDYTDVGTVEELKRSKTEFDSLGVRYFVIPGDHDLWDARNRNLDPEANFTQVFGPPYQSFEEEGVRFILLNNSDNYVGLGQEQLDWLRRELGKERGSDFRMIIAFVHEPLSHPSSTHTMGRVNKELKDQARQMLGMLKDGGVSHLLTGDIHFFTQFVDAEVGLSMTTVGAVTSQRNAQAPRFAVVHIYTDTTISVEDVEIK